MKGVLLAVALAGVALAQPNAYFDPGQNLWTLSNGRIEALFRLTGEGNFVFQRLSDLSTGDSWISPTDRPSSPIRLRADDTWYNSETAFRLVDQFTQDLDGKGIRQVIVLEDLPTTARLRLELEIFQNQWVLRYSAHLVNLRPQPVHVNLVNMLSWRFTDQGSRYVAFRVNQWSVVGKPKDFEPLHNSLDLSGKPIELYSGAQGQQCAWLALRDIDNRGLLTGWEFDGRTRTTVRHLGSDQNIEFSSNILELNHPVEPGGEFEVPAAFVGLFHGDWDEAGYRTQRFAEAVLARQVPDPQNFPYVGWDSWAYQTALDEQTLRRNAEIAARLGVELFVVDLGWSRMIGDWHADPQKFPSGLRALSDYVHSLGMKFGLHFALAEADPASPVLQQNPDWTSSESYGYFGASSLCLSNRPTREWLIEEAVRLIDDYNPDWIVQDGENMVKHCTKTTHTHDPADSNYANAVDGLNAVLKAIQQRRPQVSWENCEDGGNMMTFNMLRYYVTSSTNDASGSLSARRAAYGATYPFPPRYADRYMPEQELTSYVTHSYMFGGPWLMMNRLIDLSSDQLDFAAGELQQFKSQRGLISTGKVFHLTSTPSEQRIDALQSYDPATDSAVAVISRPQSPTATFLLRPRGLEPSQLYRIRLESGSGTWSMTGSQLMSQGVRISLPAPYSSDIAYIEPQR